MTWQHCEIFQYRLIDVEYLSGMLLSWYSVRYTKMREGLLILPDDLSSVVGYIILCTQWLDCSCVMLTFTFSFLFSCFMCTLCTILIIIIIIIIISKSRPIIQNFDFRAHYKSSFALSSFNVKRWEVKMSVYERSHFRCITVSPENVQRLKRWVIRRLQITRGVAW